jgi:hypothetical protein
MWLLVFPGSRFSDSIEANFYLYKTLPNFFAARVNSSADEYERNYLDGSNCLVDGSNIVMILKQYHQPHRRTAPLAFHCNPRPSPRLELPLLDLIPA